VSSSDTVRLARAGDIEAFPMALTVLPVIPGPVLFPKPGSPEAIGTRCACPKLDNEGGKGYAWKDDKAIYVINIDCPIHGTHRVTPDGTSSR
jgi:hypothetical protein